MGITLSQARYGKAETRVVRVRRDGDRHEIKDLNVGVALAGDLADTYLTGDNAKVLPTDSQKNTVYAFAQEHGIGEIEDFAFRLARHFLDTQAPIRWARVAIEEYRWEPVSVGGAPAPHPFARAGRETRLATLTYDGSRAWAVSGLTGLVLLNSTGSEFHGYPRDRYTTLSETRDRVLATAVDARWRHADPDAGTDWAKSYAEVGRHLVEAFADTHSLSLQQTLYAMGRRVLEQRPEVAEVRLSLPNRHHLLVDLTPFGQPNENEVFVAADRPYGLIEGTVRRDDAPPADEAW
jgi:urate oxidase